MKTKSLNSIFSPNINWYITLLKQQFTVKFSNKALARTLPIK